MRDVVAGITIAMIIIPQSMAYAELASLPPVYGLYASLIPVSLAAIFGSSRYLATGPVAMVALLTSVAVMSLSGNQENLYIYFAILLAVSVGLFQIFLALIKAGNFFDRVPEHVLLGFTSAAAGIIALTQLHKLFALPKINFDNIVNIISTHSIHQSAILISLLSLLILYFMKYHSKSLFVKNLAVFTAVVVSIIISTIFAYSGPIVANIPSGLPQITIPSYSQLLYSLPMFLMHTIIISLVGFMEAIAIAKALSIKKPEKDDKGVELFKNPSPVQTNQELFGQGIANVSSGLSGSFPVSGSFSRSAVNELAGAYSGFSSIITTIIVGLTLLYATPLLYNLPKATLGVVVIFAVLPLIRIEKMYQIYQDDKTKGTIVWLTFLSTLIFPILSLEILTGVHTHIWTGIIFGFILSFIFDKKITHDT
tara:strand:- start:111723 stop:112994 length:1272 start_codon:yes stop_codon:yes gene_type:complete